jgi:FkbM family methyltransferase
MINRAVLFLWLALISLAVLLSLSALQIRKRFRVVWRELLDLRRKDQALIKDIARVRKQLALTTVDNLRLPAHMPSEDGEELLLFNFFGRKRSGFYVDVGAYNGVDLSNSYFFEAIGWTGVLIEPDPFLFEQCLNARPYSKVLNVAVSDRPGTLIFSRASGKEWLSYVGDNPERENRIISEGGTIERISVKCQTLNEILVDCNQPIDFITIDVEGHEFTILSALDFERIRPRVFVVELSTSDSDQRVVELLGSKGYALKLRIGSNCFFTEEGDLGEFSW